MDNPNPRPPSPTGRPANERTTSAVHQSDPQIHPQELFERSQTPSETSHARLTPQIDDLHLAPRPISPDNRATTPTSNDSPTEEESESARTSPESPLPHDFEVSSGSGSSSDISSLELVSLDPSQQWEADRQRGLSLEDRVKREHFRKFAAESTTDLIATPKAPIVQLTEQPASGKSPTSKRVRHGTLKSLECTTIPSSSRSPSGGADEGTENSSVPSSPGFQSRFMRVFSSSTSTDQSPPVSPIFTPLSPLSSLSAPWASRTTLVSEKTSPKTQAMKRKESLVFRKLFHVMGKEREKEKEKAKDPISAPESNNEALECWEVVDPDTFQTKSYHGNRNSRIRRESEVSTSRLPIGPLNTSSPAFLNRAVRPMHGGSSVGLPSSPSSLLLASPTRAATSPILRGMYSPAPSLTNGSEAEASTQQKLRVRKPPPSPLTRSLNPSVRQSPSIVWKSNDRPKSPPQTPTSPSVDESPTTPTSAPSPPLVRPRATSALPSLSMPPQIMISNSQQAEPFPLSETPSPPPSPLPAVLQTPTFVRPSLPSLTTPSTPQTPNSRHYAGRPLPQPPTEHSPFGRPIYSPSPPPSAPPTPQQQRHRSTPAIFSQYTDFDALVSRIEDGPHDGRHYDVCISNAK